MEESRNRGLEEIDLQDKGITNIAEVPYLCKTIQYKCLQICEKLIHFFYFN